MRDYKEELVDLKKNSNSKMEVTAEEFLEFRKAWLADPDHQQIVGKAHKGGKIIYMYIPENDEK